MNGVWFCVNQAPFFVPRCGERGLTALLFPAAAGLAVFALRGCGSLSLAFAVIPAGGVMNLFRGGGNPPCFSFLPLFFLFSLELHLFLLLRGADELRNAVISRKNQDHRQQDDHGKPGTQAIGSKEREKEVVHHPCCSNTGGSDQFTNEKMN